MRPRPLRAAACALSAALSLGAPATLWASPAAPSAASSSASRSSFCPPPWHARSADLCALPGAGEAAPLLVYFPGILPAHNGSAIQQKLQRVLLEHAARSGSAVLLPRGLRGQAPASTPNWSGWPTGARSFAALAPGVIAELRAAQRELERERGAAYAKVYLAGSSSGAYFVAGVAAAGLWPADGYAALSGGSAPATTLRAAPHRAPFYVGYGAYDGAAHHPRALGATLHQLGWPSLRREHLEGHGARLVYLTEAAAFWAEADAHAAATK